MNRYYLHRCSRCITSMYRSSFTQLVVRINQWLGMAVIEYRKYIGHTLQRNHNGIMCVITSKGKGRLRVMVCYHHVAYLILTSVNVSIILWLAPSTNSNTERNKDISVCKRYYIDVIANSGTRKGTTAIDTIESMVACTMQCDGHKLNSFQFFHFDWCASACNDVCQYGIKNDVDHFDDDTLSPHVMCASSAHGLMFYFVFHFQFCFPLPHEKPNETSHTHTHISDQPTKFCTICVNVHNTLAKHNFSVSVCGSAIDYKTFFFKCLTQRMVVICAFGWWVSVCIAPEYTT